MPPAQSDIFATATAQTRDAYQPSPFDGILERSRDLICARLDEAVAVMLDSAHELLTTLIKETQVREEWRLYEEAREVATQQRETIEEHFRSAYRVDFQRRSDRARKIGKPFDKLAYSCNELELIGEDDYDETLKFNDMAHKLRGYCEEELSALDQRVGVLLGDASLESKDNPFSPNVICDAFKLACRQLECSVPVRRVLLKLFDDQVLDEIRSVYKAVNALLVRHSILPQIRYSVARAGDGPSAAGAASVAQAAAPGPMGAGAAQDLFSMLQSLVASNPGARAAPAGWAAAADAGAASAGGMIAGVGPIGAGMAAGGIAAAGGAAAGGVFAIPAGQSAMATGMGFAAGAATGPVLADATGAGTPSALPLIGNPVVFLQGTELLSALTRIQRGDSDGSAAATTQGDGESAPIQIPAGVALTTNVLHQIKTSSVGAGMNDLDRMTLDIIAMLFDELFDDPKVPNAIKGLIGRLQIPMLKVAIADKSFFATKSHPARRLLDAVGQVALRLPADFTDSNPLFGRLDASVQKLVEGYQDSLEIFAATRDELLAMMAEEDARIETESLSVTRQAEEMENLALARAAAQKEIQARMQEHALPPAVIEFLALHWVKFLLLAHVKDGGESEAWRQALEAMDQLIWSIEVKKTTEDRRKLAALVPGLIKQLTSGLKSAQIEDEVRDQFFAELLKFHTQALGAPAQASVLSAPVSAASTEMLPAPSPIAAAAAEPAGEAPPALSLDFTAPLTVKNPFGEGEVRVDNPEVDLDFTAEATENARLKREASIRRALDNLKMGQWIEFHDPGNEGSRRTGRLIFISPRKTRYLFATDRAGKEIIQCTRAEMGRRLRLGEAVRLDEPPEESLFDRIMNGLLCKLRLSGRAPLFAQQGT
ncbi:MAG: DUF1631 domain-containing protein [Burkholderiales bacterium]|nr:DUF1631 domain-containing protein [Burkholderiales bacterium]